MFKYKVFLTILLLSTYSLTCYSENEAGFDEICRIYTEAHNSNMSINVLSSYIFNNIKKRVSSNDALEAHDVVMNTDSITRYTLFKGSAEYTLKRPWDCLPMKAVMNKPVK